MRLYAWTITCLVDFIQTDWWLPYLGLRISLQKKAHTNRQSNTTLVSSFIFLFNEAHLFLSKAYLQISKTNNNNNNVLGDDFFDQFLPGIFCYYCDPVCIYIFRNVFYMYTAADNDIIDVLIGIRIFRKLVSYVSRLE